MPVGSHQHASSHERQLCGQFARPSWWRAIWQLGSTFAAFLTLWLLMSWLVHARWDYGWALLVAIPCAGLYVRLFVIQHDCGHGSFFRSRGANRWAGRCLGIITLFPYGYWKRTHAVHHGTSGNLDRREFGDIRTFTVAEYRACTRWRRVCYRAYRSMPVLLGIGPLFQLVIKHRAPFNLPLSWRREWGSVLLNDLMLIVLWGGCAVELGWRCVLLVQLPLLLLAGALGVWLFYVQHVFENTYWSRGPRWKPSAAALGGSSYYALPPVLHWFTANIGYHHIHHLDPRIPNYNLRAAFDSSSQLRTATCLTLRSSLQCARLKLWDEDRGCMVGLPDRVGSPHGPNK